MRTLVERKLYPHVATWLAEHLRSKYPGAEISAHDTHSTELGAFLRRANLHSKFPDVAAFEIQVDITAIIQAKNSVRLAFVECKLGPITLMDVGQLLGYCLVARPERAFLVSPRGLSDRLTTLLVTFGRQDILKYSDSQSMRLAAWNPSRREIDVATLVPKGSHD